MNMGRKVEFLENPKERASRYITRKNGLIKKANELSVLCGVDCCVIIMNNNNLDSVDHVWSSSSETDVVGDLIGKYRCGPKGVYGVSDYYVDQNRKVPESVVASAKKRDRECVHLSTWNSRFDSMNEFELRNLAGDLEIKIDSMKNRRELMMKNKRLKTVIDDNPRGPSLIQDNRMVAINSIEENDMSSSLEHPMAVVEPDVVDMNPIADMNSLDQESVMDRMGAMNSIEENNSCNPDMNPVAAMSSLEQAIVLDKMEVKTNSIENNGCCNLQAIAVIDSDVVNEMMPPMYDDSTLTDLQQQCFYDPSHPFVNHDSGAQTEADVFSDSFLMSPVMISADVPEISTDLQDTCDYNWNVFDFSLSDCFPMQEAYCCGNSQMENCVSRQSFACPPPLML